jgi:hypothetical protein
MSLHVTNLDTPDQKRSFDHGQLQIANFDGVTIARAVFNPG